MDVINFIALQWRVLFFFFFIKDETNMTLGSCQVVSAFLYLFRALQLAVEAHCKQDPKKHTVKAVKGI